MGFRIRGGQTTYVARITKLCIAAIFVLFVCAQSPLASAQSPEVRIAAAADLTAAFKEIGPIFEKKTGLHPLFTFGASGLIARQIEQGAPFDLFASANTDFITVLALKGLTLPNTEKPYAVGHIGIFSVKHHPRTLRDLTSPVYQKVAIANPKTAPYGKAAQEALTSAGVWPAVQPRLVFGDNIRQTQQFALSGNADAAIVSASQGIESKSQGNFVPIPDELHNPLVQSLAILKSSANPAGANAFIQFLLGKQGQAIIRKYGFSAPPTTKQNSPSAKRSGL